LSGYERTFQRQTKRNERTKKRRDSQGELGESVAGSSKQQKEIKYRIAKEKKTQPCRTWGAVVVLRPYRDFSVLLKQGTGQKLKKKKTSITRHEEAFINGNCVVPVRRRNIPSPLKGLKPW